MFWKKKNEIIVESKGHGDKHWVFGETEATVFDKYDIAIIFCGYKTNQYNNKKRVFVFKVINKSKNDVTLQCDGLAINHQMYENTMSAAILRDSWGYAELKPDAELDSIDLENCQIQCKLALCNNFLFDRRYHIDFFLDLKELYDVKNTKKYKELLKERDELIEKCKKLESEK